MLSHFTLIIVSSSKYITTTLIMINLELKEIKLLIKNRTVLSLFRHMQCYKTKKFKKDRKSVV